MSKPSRQLIQAVPLFAELDDATTDRLAEDFVIREFAPGTAIATEGSGGLNFFIVESGEASVTVNGEPVATLGPGSSFGEVALVDKEARTATVTATTEMRTYALPVWSFRSFIETRPAVTWKLLEILADRLRASEARHRG